MKKLSTLFILTAIAGLVSFNAYADTHAPAGFGMRDFGGFSRFGGFGYSFGGFGHGMDFAGGFGGFGHGMDFTAHTRAFNPDPTIVPLPPTASASASSITYDENGEIHVRPFDDEDLFVED